MVSLHEKQFRKFSNHNSFTFALNLIYAQAIYFVDFNDAAIENFNSPIFI
jgi:hypothetical protein